VNLTSAQNAVLLKMADGTKIFPTDTRTGIGYFLGDEQHTPCTVQFRRLWKLKLVEFCGDNLHARYRISAAGRREARR
jgi:hypothetical protein